MQLRRCPCTPAIAAVADLAMARPCSGRVSKFGGESDGFNAVADVLGARSRIPISLFRTIQDTLKYLPRGLRYCLNPEDAVQNGRRHVDVNLLGMWWSASVVVLCLRGMWR